MAHCVRWINATVPRLPDGSFDPVNFCSGFETGNVGGLYSNCSQTPARPEGDAPGNCNFIGLTMPGDTMAFSVRTPSRDGHEFLAATEDPANDPQRIAATFYSRTPFLMQDLRLPSGMYKLFPYQSSEGWKLVVARQDGEWNDAPNPSQYLGQVTMNTVAMDYPYTKLYAYLSLFSQRCPGAQPARNIRELEFAFGNTDVSVCLRPDQVSPIREEELSKR